MIQQGDVTPSGGRASGEKSEALGRRQIPAEPSRSIRYTMAPIKSKAFQ